MLVKDKSQIHKNIQTEFNLLKPETQELFNDYMHEYHKLGQEFESATGLTVSYNDINLENPIIPKSEYQPKYSLEDFLSENEVRIPSLSKYNLHISRYGTAKATGEGDLLLYRVDNMSGLLAHHELRALLLPVMELTTLISKKCGHFDTDIIPLHPAF